MTISKDAKGFWQSDGTPSDPAGVMVVENWILASSLFKPAFNGEVTLAQTMVAADFDCLARVYHMVFSFSDFTFPASTNHNFTLLTLPPGAFITGFGAAYSKHEIQWLAPGLSNLFFRVRTDFGAQDIHTNQLLDGPPGDFNIGWPDSPTSIGQMRSPDAMGASTFTIDGNLQSVGANLNTITAGELDVWLRLAILEDNPSVKFS